MEIGRIYLHLEDVMGIEVPLSQSLFIFSIMAKTTIKETLRLRKRKVLRPYLFELLILHICKNGVLFLSDAKQGGRNFVKHSLSAWRCICYFTILFKIRHFLVVRTLT